MIINAAFLAKVLRLDCWAVVILCSLHKTLQLYRHQKHPKAEHLCSGRLVLCRKQVGKTMTTSRIACSLGLHGNVGNRQVWDPQHPLPPETPAPKPSPAAAKGNILVDFSAVGVGTQKGRLP